MFSCCQGIGFHEDDALGGWLPEFSFDFLLEHLYFDVKLGETSQSGFGVEVDLLTLWELDSPFVDFCVLLSIDVSLFIFLIELPEELKLAELGF
jgi:hypothetical protein